MTDNKKIGPANPPVPPLEPRQDKKPDKPQQPEMITKANEAAERIEKANKEMKEQLDRHDLQMAEERLGGITEAGKPQMTEEEKQINEAKKMLVGTGFEDMLDKPGAV